MRKYAVLEKIVTTITYSVSFSSFKEMFDFLTLKHDGVGTYLCHRVFYQQRRKSEGETRKWRGELHTSMYFPNRSQDKGRMMPGMKDKATGKETWGASMWLELWRDNWFERNEDFTDLFDADGNPLEDKFAEKYDIRDFKGELVESTTEEHGVKAK